MDPTTEDCDRQFAAFVADLHAHIDDPVNGKENRELLSEDPEHLRALWDFAGAMATGEAGPLPSAVLAYMLLLIAGAVAVLAVIYTNVGHLL
jgi:hypothetical protein